MDGVQCCRMYVSGGASALCSPWPGGSRGFVAKMPDTSYSWPVTEQSDTTRMHTGSTQHTSCIDRGESRVQTACYCVLRSETMRAFGGLAARKHRGAATGARRDMGPWYVQRPVTGYRWGNCLWEGPAYMPGTTGHNHVNAMHGCRVACMHTCTHGSLKACVWV